MLRNDVNKSPTTYKRANQKSSIIRGLLNGSIKRMIMGRLGRSLEEEAFENWGQHHLLEEHIILPHLLLRQSMSDDFPTLLQYDCIFQHVPSLHNRNLTLHPSPLPPSCLPPSPAGVLTHKPQQVRDALGRHSL